MQDRDAATTIPGTTRDRTEATAVHGTPLPPAYDTPVREDWRIVIRNRVKAALLTRHHGIQG
jgi:hypothetical protein